MPLVAEQLLALGLRQGRALKLKIPNWIVNSREQAVTSFEKLAESVGVNRA